MSEFNQGAYDAFLSSIADLSDGAYIQACMDYLMNEQGLSSVVRAKNIHWQVKAFRV